MSEDEKLLRELEGDLAHLRRKAIREIDQVMITQSNIRLLKARINKLKRLWTVNVILGAIAFFLSIVVFLK